MLNRLRKNWIQWIVGIVVGLIIIVFALEGFVFNRAARGMSGGAVAGAVNGEKISLGEFNRAVERTSDYYKQIMGGASLSEEQIKMFRVREAAFQELVRSKLMVQSVEKEGLSPGDERIREEIKKIPAFSKEGRFDPILYKSVLEANQMSPYQFETMVRNDLALDEFRRSLQAGIRVTDPELKKAYEDRETKRAVEYVTANKKEDADKIYDWLLAHRGKALTEAEKKKWKEEKIEIASRPLSSESDIASLISDRPEQLKEIFKPKLNTKEEKPLRWEAAGRFHVLLVTQATDVNWSQFEKTKKELQASVRVEKAQFLLEQTLKDLTEKASIDANPEVVGEWNPGKARL